MARPVASIVFCLVTCSAYGQVLFRESGAFLEGKEPKYTASVAVPRSVSVGVLGMGPEGTRLTLRDASGWEAPASPMGPKPFFLIIGDPHSPVEVLLEGAVGDAWRIGIAGIPDRETLYPFLATGPLMMLAAVAAVVWWRRKTGVLWRWFWAGAAVWSVGVALKFAWAIPLNGPITNALDAALPEGIRLLAASVYTGLLTGVFEIGITLAAAFIWRRMAMTATAAIAVGIGAGAFEAMLLGLAGFLNIAVAASGAPGAEQMRVMLVLGLGSTPVAWLVGPVERIITMACHTGARALTLLTVASGKWRYFWYGFLIMTAIDSVAGFVHFKDLVGTISLWWIELALLPASILSVFAARWCYYHWPAVPTDQTGSQA